jgi:DNA-binding transcriptional regulator YiaG
LPPAQPAWALWQTSPEVVAEVDRLLNDHTDAQVAALLNARGWHSGKGRAFTRSMITQIRYQYDLRSLFDRLRAAGMLTQEEMSDRLEVSRATVHDWRRSGLLKARAANDKPEYLYEPVGQNGPIKWQGLKRSDPRRFAHVPSEKTKEVQDEA